MFFFKKNLILQKFYVILRKNLRINRITRFRSGTLYKAVIGHYLNHINQMCRICDNLLSQDCIM